jgi:hypothetical protein
MSSQNFTLSPLPTMKLPLEKNSSITFMIPFQNKESDGWEVNWDKLFECKYLLVNNSYHTSTSFNSLNSHLQSRILFF